MKKIAFKLMPALLLTILPAKAETYEDDITSYATNIRNVIKSITPNIESYSGQRCSMQIELDKNGVISKVIIKSGDKPLCETMKKAIINKNVGKPNPRQYKVFKNSSLDFVP